MKICAIADLHGRLPGQNGIAPIPECDVLLIAGDIAPDFAGAWDPGVMCVRQLEWLDSDYREWEQTVPAKHIFATPGNHDWFQKLPDTVRTKLFIDEGCEVYDEVLNKQQTFWFTPWITPICDWNYMLTRTARKRQFDLIPYGLSVLVSHSPIHKVCDQSYSGEHCGCEELRAIVRERKPKHFCYGHIHEAQRFGGPNHTFERTGTHCCSLWGTDRGWEPVTFDLWD